MKKEEKKWPMGNFTHAPKFFVEPQGFEPWSREDEQRAFYMLSQILIVGKNQVIGNQI